MDQRDNSAYNGLHIGSLGRQFAIFDKLLKKIPKFNQNFSKKANFGQNIIKKGKFGRNFGEISIFG
jgi:hypothetical protein